MAHPARSTQPENSKDTTLNWILATAIVVFLIPLVAMQFTAEINWSPLDFAVWGTLLTAAGSAFLWASLKLPRSKRLGVGVLIGAVFVYVWAELAVGIFTNLGS